MNFNSPWLQTSPPSWPSLNKQISADITIIGGGISGVAALYFLLTETNKNVILVEKNRIASGATGHNAGIAVAYIEKSADELVKELGLDGTQKLLQELQVTWGIFLNVINTINAENNFIPFQHTALGYTSIETVLKNLSKQDLDKTLHRQKKFYIADLDTVKKQIPIELHHKVDFIPHDDILKLLHIHDHDFIAASTNIDPFRIARVNSAELCLQIIAYLQKNYANRFKIYENTNIKKINLSADYVILQHTQGTMQSNNIILCTNGYTDFEIYDEVTKTVPLDLSALITPRLGYVIGFDEKRETGGNAYFDERGIYGAAPYFYLSHANDLTIIGGPEYDIDAPQKITDEIIQDYAKESLEIFKEFFHRSLNKSELTYKYFWQGRMGYTQDGLRLSGQSEQHPRLWFSLGCNGIGIVPAFGTAKQIAGALR